MLLFLLGLVNLRLNNPIVFMSFASNFIQNVADFMMRTYAVKLSLLYLVASARAISYENNPSFLAVCNDSSMQLNVDFLSPFHGLIYTSGNAFIPQCSFPTSPLLNDTKLMLTLPFSTCSFVADAKDNETSITSTIVVQQHRMMRTTQDIIQNVTCELSLPLDTVRQWYFLNTTVTPDHPNASLPSSPEVSTWIETMIGSDLFPNDDSEVGAELFFVVNVRDGGKNQDMAVHNCIAHDDKVLTNETRLYQMSDVFGCSNTSYVLSNFTVSNQTEGPANLMAYTQMRNLVYTVKGEFFITCGVVLCEKSCRNMCEYGDIPTMHYLSDIVVKRFVGRLPDATLPPSLDLFETRQRISKRSFSDILTGWFTFGSSDSEVKEDTFQDEDNSTESTLIPLEEELDDTTDAFYDANISKDLTLNVSDNPLVRSAILLVNETTLSGFGHNNKILKNSVLPEFTVCILFMLLVSCYGGLLYSNSKRNLRNTADRNNFMTELYSIVH